MNVSDILSRLEHVKPTGPGKWTASCPLPDHDDKKPSMSVTVEGDRILMFCHRCAASGDHPDDGERDRLTCPVRRRVPDGRRGRRDVQGVAILGLPSP
jgi:hypothetical protein